MAVQWPLGSIVAEVRKHPDYSTMVRSEEEIEPLGRTHQKV